MESLKGVAIVIAMVVAVGLVVVWSNREEPAATENRGSTISAPSN